MKLTRAATYALQAVAYMANQKKSKEDHPIASHRIADERKIPERFLLKVLKPLVSAQILMSIKGPNGGYRLAKSPYDISMLDVVEAVDGPIRGTAPLNPRDPDHGLHRKLDQVCSHIADQMRKQLAKVRVSDLAGR
jgi:Rrf2 family protein